MLFYVVALVFGMVCGSGLAEVLHRALERRRKPSPEELRMLRRALARWANLWCDEKYKGRVRTDAQRCLDDQELFNACTCVGLIWIPVEEDRP